MLALSKVLSPADFDQLTEELRIVDRHFTSAREQHPMRRWEYAMALRALNQWRNLSYAGPFFYDVGGAGSPFASMVGATIVDPEAAQGHEPYTLADFVGKPGITLASCVFCLSVLEHVDDLDHFLYHLACLVAPGGLLFLTMDYCQDDTVGWPPDIYHFHWDRRRIFNELQRKQLRSRFLQRDFETFGEYGWGWPGPQVFDYSFASLAMVKRA